MDQNPCLHLIHASNRRPSKLTLPLVQPLQHELADVEDKFAAAKFALNAAVARFNAACESFPTVLCAGMIGFAAVDFDRLA